MRCLGKRADVADSSLCHTRDVAQIRSEIDYDHFIPALSP